MHTKAIKDQLTVKPFEPFEFVLSSGDRYPVRHPENVVLMKERVFLAYHETERPGLPDRSTSISYLHIAALEPIPRPAGTGAEAAQRPNE